MATDLYMPYARQVLTANGGADGTLTVTSTALFRKGARVLLKDGNTDAIELIVDEVVSATVLAVRNPAVIGSVRFDCSAYTTAQNAAVVQNPQPDYYARERTWF